MSRRPPSHDDWFWQQEQPDDPAPTPPLAPERHSIPAAPPSGPVLPASSSGPFAPFGAPDVPEMRFDERAFAYPPVRSSRARRRQTIARVVAPILLVALLTGFIVVLRLPDSSARPVITQATTNPTIQAYIVGAVVNPGVYPLQSGDRVYSLLQAAGGATSDADLACIDLAATVVDGEEVYVPHKSERVAGGPINCTVAKVNINTTSANDLHLLLGISTSTANKIVAYRNEHGPFTSIQQLIPVIGLSIYNRIKDFITV